MACSHAPPHHCCRSLTHTPLHLCHQVCYCLKMWQELPPSVRNGGRPSKEEALLAVAVLNRIRRAITQVSHSDIVVVPPLLRSRTLAHMFSLISSSIPYFQISDTIMKRIADVARVYGEAFGVEPWARDLFGEEVRANYAFLEVSGFARGTYPLSSCHGVITSLLCLAGPEGGGGLGTVLLVARGEGRSNVAHTATQPHTHTQPHMHTHTHTRTPTHTQPHTTTQFPARRGPRAPPPREAARPTPPPPPHPMTACWRR